MELAALGAGDEPFGDSPAEMRTLRLIQKSDLVPVTATTATLLVKRL